MPLSTAGQGEVLLALDYDGVLHHEACYWSAKRGPYLEAPERYTLFQHMALLEELLAPHPEVKIILSTSWVVRYGYIKASKRLSPGLRARCIGSTFNSDIKGDGWHYLSRGEQVTNDMLKRKPRAWFALDDTFLHWPPQTVENLIITDPYEGISPPEIQDAIRAKLVLLTSGAQA